MYATNGGAGILIGGGGDRTGVQNNDFGGVRRGRTVESTFGELLFNRGAIGLSGPAAKILDVKTRHAYILT